MYSECQISDACVHVVSLLLICVSSVSEYPLNVFMCDGKSSYSSNFAVIKSVALSMSLLLFLFLFLYLSTPRTLVFIVFRILCIYLCLKFMTFLLAFEMSVVSMSYHTAYIPQLVSAPNMVIPNIFRSLTHSLTSRSRRGRLFRVHHVPPRRFPDTR